MTFQAGDSPLNLSNLKPVEVRHGGHNHGEIAPRSWDMMWGRPITMVIHSNTVHFFTALPSKMSRDNVEHDDHQG
jgi:hypothetical protein